MAIIELNLEKPALKRVESVAEKQEEEQIEAEVNPEEASEMVETVETEDVAVEETESSGGSRLKRLAIVGGTAAGIAAARKLRQRRKSKGQQDLEEDWQTAE